jgi:ABC-type transport system substrate-binding protein
MEGSSNVSVFTVTRPFQHLVVLNTQSPALQSRETRKALNLAVDRAAIVREALNGHGVASKGPVAPRYWALPPDAPTLEYDPNLAARLVSARAGVPSKQGGGITFTCLVTPDAVNERVALALKRQLQAVGVLMNVEQTPLDQMFDRMARRDYDAALLEGMSGPTLLRAYFFWHSNTAFNTSGSWANATVDAAFERARRATSEKEYIEAVGGLQRAFVDDPPAIFLAWSVRARAVSKRFLVPPLEPGRDVLSTLRLWKPATGDLRASRN